MKNVTGKYITMITSFECDYSCASSGDIEFSVSQNSIDSNEKLSRDIGLLSELEFGLRHGKYKIMEV
jgi:hypothetical protein